MAALDPYAPCPCGSGAKYKWCCQKAEPYVERSQRLLENDQLEPALKALDEGLRAVPENPWLALRKAVLLGRRGEPKPAVELLKRVVARHPQHAGARALLVRLAAQAEGPTVAAGALQEALAALGPEHRAELADEAELIGALMADAGQVPASLAHLRLAQRLEPEDAEDSAPPGQTLRMIESNPALSSWLRNPYHLSPVPEGLEDARRERFAQALRDADEGLWAPAAAAFDALAAVGTPESDRNLGLCRLWLGDERGALEALRRYTAWVGANPDTVDLEALCQLIAPPGRDERVDLLQWIWPLRRRDELLAALKADPSVEPAGREPIDPNDPESVEVDVFLILDRPKPEAKDVRGPEDLPRVRGRVLVGLELAVLEAYDDGRLDALAEWFRERAGEAIPPAHPRTKVVGKGARSALALRTEWVTPAGLDAATLDRLEREDRLRLLREVWPETPLPALRRRTPRQAARDGDAELPLRAALCLLADANESAEEDAATDALRAELNVPPEPALDPATVAIDAVPLGRLRSIPIDALDDARLVALYARAHRSLLRRVLEPAARALVERPGALEGRTDVSRYVVFADLAYIAMARGEKDQALQWVSRGRRSDPDGGRGAEAARWDLLAVRIRARTEPPEQWVPELAAVLERHKDPEANSLILTTLLDLGLLRAAPHPDKPGEVILDSRPLQAVLTRYGPRITTAGGELGISATKGGLWTPESGAAGGLWTPDAAPPPAAEPGEKPRLIIPGR
jgi:tetratricopeptide (TPR) repeat protein